MQKIQFDYFTGMEAEQYSFYRVPKVLFTAECFKSLSCELRTDGWIQRTEYILFSRWKKLQS